MPRKYLCLWFLFASYKKDLLRPLQSYFWEFALFPSPKRFGFQPLLGNLLLRQPKFYTHLSSRRVHSVVGFLSKIPGGGGRVLWEGEGPGGREGVCGESGNFGRGGGANFFFRGRNGYLRKSLLTPPDHPKPPQTPNFPENPALPPKSPRNYH